MKNIPEATQTPPGELQIPEGLPAFLDQIGRALLESQNQIKLNEDRELIRIMEQGAQRSAEDLAGFGFSLAQMVHFYGAICQSITEIAMAKEFLIRPFEFQQLNWCMDLAISATIEKAVEIKSKKDRNREVEHIGELAHELRNSLAVVNASVQILKSGTVGPSGSVGRILEKGLQRMQELVDRSISEVRFGSEKVTPKVCALDEILEPILSSLHREARAREQKVEVRIDPNLRIETDPGLIHSALSNLVQNAWKYTCEGGIIQVRVRDQGDQICFEVEDQCGGLKSERLSDLFKPFEQHNGNRSGLGLGLTIAEKAVQRLKGKITVENFAGKGCQFSLSFPKKWTESPSGFLQENRL